MLLDFAHVLTFVLAAMGLVVVCLLFAALLAPKAPTQNKAIPYECGELPKGTPWIQFNPRYLRMALIFLVFEVEVAVTFPCAVVFRRWVERGQGWVILMELAIFFVILGLGLAYAWKMGDLEWVRSKVSPRVDAGESPS